MRIALVGPTGFIGSKVLIEAVKRGHLVTAICRNPAKVPALEGVTPRIANMLRRGEAEVAFAGHDVVISCFNVGHHPEAGRNIYKDTIDGVVNIIKATKSSGVNRLIFVGGGGALYVAPGKQLVETLPVFSDGELDAQDWPEDLESKMPPEFALWADLMEAGVKHEHIKPLVHALMFFEHDQSYDWSFFSPPAALHPGPGTGRFELGGNMVPMRGEKFAGLPIEDAAIAIVDEVENGTHRQQHWTAFSVD